MMNNQMTFGTFDDSVSKPGLRFLLSTLYMYSVGQKNVVKDCVNKTETNAPFDHVFWPTEYNDKNHDM